MENIDDNKVQKIRIGDYEFMVLRSVEGKVKIHIRDVRMKTIKVFETGNQRYIGWRVAVLIEQLITRPEDN